jgi:hypothetical protein
MVCASERLDEEAMEEEGCMEEKGRISVFSLRLGWGFGG